MSEDWFKGAWNPPLPDTFDFLGLFGCLDTDLGPLRKTQKEAAASVR